MKKKDLLLIGIILLAAAICWIGFRLSGDDKGDILVITVDGKVYGTYELAEDQVIAIGSTNQCEIKDGVVRMTEADCPDQLCRKQKSIDASGGTIVCLPNKVVLEISNSGQKKENQIDTIAQ